MALTILVTNAGRAALVNAANTGTAPVTIAQVGLSGSVIVPAPTDAALPGEFKRIATLSGDVVADDTIHLIVRDEGTDVFTLRSFALYLADGTLFALYGQAPVLLEKSAQAMMLLTIDVRFEDIDATTLTFGDANFLNPPATTERQGVVELATHAEAQAGIDALRALTPSSARAAILGWLLAEDGAGSGLDADLLDGQQGSYYSNITGRLGYTPWYFGNDGAGSGLDADLLDGQDGSYYANVAGRLGYTPANRAGDTFTGPIRRDNAFYFDFSEGNPLINFDAFDYFVYDRVNNGLSLLIGGQTRIVSRLTGDLDFYGTARMGFNGNLVWNAGNDGAGSGLDADLLDGQHGSYYADVVGRLGFTPVNRAGDVITGSLRIAGVTQFTDTSYYMGVLDGRPVINFDALDYFSFDRGSDTLTLIIGGQQRMVARQNGNLDFFSAGSVYFNSVPFWHAGNDGAGSGLDADLFDGHQADAFDRIVAQNLSENGGYTIYASGRKETWGVITIGQDTYATYYLPCAHASWVHPTFGLSSQGGNSQIQQNTGITSINGAPPDSITFWNADDRVVTIWVRTTGV